MNKKSIIVLLAISIIAMIIIFASVFTRNVEEVPQIDDGYSDEVEKSTTIEIRDKRSQMENSKKSINTIIPEFQNLENDFQNTINNKINKELNDVNVYNLAIEGWEEDEVGKFTYEVTYDRYNSGKYLSIVASQYIHIGNGRPRMQKKCYVIDVERNATALLEDVFEKKYEYKDAIIKEINEQASRSGIELIGGNGLNELNKNQAFYIMDNKLVIYFEASDIAATAVGELEFIMPYKMVDGKFVIEN